MKNKKDDLAQFCRSIQSIMKCLQLRGKELLLKRGFSFAQYYALFCLRDGKLHPMSTLKENLSITGAGATGCANQLVKKGFAQRERAQRDRRIVNIKITEKGKKVFFAIDDKRKEYLFSRFNKIEEKEKKKVLKALEILENVLKL